MQTAELNFDKMQFFDNTRSPQHGSELRTMLITSPLLHKYTQGDKYIGRRYYNFSLFTKQRKDEMQYFHLSTQQRRKSRKNVLEWVIQDLIFWLEDALSWSGRDCYLHVDINILDSEPWLSAP